MYALVTNKLAHPILLGLTFIHLNQLIIDTKIGTVIDKHCEYNIMISNSKILTFLILIMEVLDTSRPNKYSSQELNKKYYKEFSDCFKEILYAYQLLTNIYHPIKFKDLSISFIARTYFYSQKLQGT